MADSLLTENQRRHLATYAHLLQEDLDQLRRLPELWRPAPLGDRLHDAMASVDAALRRLEQAFELPERLPMDARRRVAAVANIWAARIPELRAGRMRAYGAVHPRLAVLLDPLVEELTRQLFALARAANAPERKENAC
ncbi:MAG TPA: hypothetical protein VNL18_06450 [Gemmatimonadales bacterium]|nr:hypothetical protein [Gemmatimonadales bacterium]